MSVQVVFTVREGTDRSLTIEHTVMAGDDATRSEKDVALALHGLFSTASQIVAKRVVKKEGSAE